MSYGPTSPPYDIIVFGAGITGLATAWELARKSARVLVLESADRAGGVIRSERTPGGYLLEHGPNSFSTTPGILELMERVGIRGRAIMRPMCEHDRFVFKSGRLYKVPTGPGAFLATGLLTPGEKIRLVRGAFRKCPPLAADVSAGEFFRARIGDAPVDSLLKPFVAGIYASDADRISLASTFPAIFDAAAPGGSLMRAVKSMMGKSSARPKAPRSLVSFPGGLEELPRRLQQDLVAAGGRIRLGVRAMIDPTHDGTTWRVQVPGTLVPIRTKKILLACPAAEAADLLDRIAPETARALRAIEYARLNVVHVSTRDPGPAVRHRNGFGFLSVAGQGVSILGSIWNSDIFPDRAPDRHRLLTCFYGGEIDPEATTWDNDRLAQQVMTDLEKTMGSDAPAARVLSVTRWDKALPIFRLGHRERMQQALAALPPGLELAGNFLGRVSIPDRVKIAAELASR